MIDRLMHLARAILLTLRPHQWVKNLFVAAPVVFAKRLLDGPSVLLAILAAASFCARPRRCESPSRR